jgi:hypothetical protein
MSVKMAGHTGVTLVMISTIGGMTPSVASSSNKSLQKLRLTHRFCYRAKKGKTVGYYNTTSGSFGFQAGVQSFGYALFFMTPEDLAYLERSSGWEIGVGPSITIVDVGLAGSLSTTTMRKGVYAFFFDQKGLMGGLGLQGTKITRIHPK